jgi:hypothetical protein
MVFFSNRHIDNSATHRASIAVAFAISSLLLGGPAYATAWPVKCLALEPPSLARR